jgi:dTDP-4-dehydrorhamnose reductase
MIENRLKMVITGVSGLLGNNLALYFRRLFDVVGLYHRHPVHFEAVETAGCDLTSRFQVNNILKRFQPEVVVHCASLTSVDLCELDPAAAHLHNVVATENLAVQMQSTNSALVYISTDAVYEGTKGNYSEKDPVCPQNHYGRTKLAGEKIVRQMKKGLILRTNFFGLNIQPKQSLAEWLLDRLARREPINGFHDAIFSSIYILELARVIEMALSAKLAGTFNCGTRDACSKYDFGRRLALVFGLNPNLILPVSIDGHHFAAKRGKNLSLNVSKIEKAINCRLPSIDECIQKFFEDYKAGHEKATH